MKLWFKNYESAALILRLRYSVATHWVKPQWLGYRIVPKNKAQLRLWEFAR
jgi:hypothetical protein